MLIACRSRLTLFALLDKNRINKADSILVEGGNRIKSGNLFTDTEQGAKELEKVN